MTIPFPKIIFPFLICIWVTITCLFRLLSYHVRNSQGNWRASEIGFISWAWVQSLLIYLPVASSTDYWLFEEKIVYVESASLGSLALTLLLLHFPFPCPHTWGAGNTNSFNVKPCFKWRRMKNTVMFSQAFHTCRRNNCPTFSVPDSQFFLSFFRPNVKPEQDMISNLFEDKMLQGMPLFPAPSPWKPHLQWRYQTVCFFRKSHILVLPFLASLSHNRSCFQQVCMATQNAV